MNANFASAVSTMDGNSHKAKVDLADYHNAMVFYGSGFDYTGLKLAIYSYARQLLVCIGKDVTEDGIDVVGIRKMFLNEETFKHIHEQFRTSNTVDELNVLMDVMYEELCKYVSDDELCCEPEDVDIWWNLMRYHTIEKVGDEVSKDMRNFLLELDSNGLFTKLWWIDSDVDNCTGFAWLGKEAAINYGSGNKNKYSDTLIKWCNRLSISDIESEKNRLCKLFNVHDDDKLDEYLELNMVD